MTLGELANYAQSQFKLTQTKISDWRPAGDMYIDDLCFPFVADSKDWVSIPNGIRFWLEMVTRSSMSKARKVVKRDG